MKFLLIGLVFIMSNIFHSQVTELVTVEVNDIARTYRLYIPAIYDGSTSVPVIFNFHGYSSNSFEQELYGNFKPIADTANFLIILPQGLTQNNITGFNNFGSLEILQPELDFFNTMLDDLDTDYNIDLSRIYSTGISNGGFMSYDLACYQSDKIAAIASVAGSMMELHLSDCDSEHPMPIMQIHGTADEVVLYDGFGDFVYSEPIENLVNYWVEFNNCDETPVQTNLPDINLIDLCTAEHYVYNNGASGVSVEFYKIIDGGHTWPGAFPVATLGVTNQDFNACKEIWRFFSQYSLDNLVTIEENESDVFKTKVYPNPVSDILTIESNESSIFILYDLTGKIILEKKINDIIENIDITNLSSGSYLYSVSNKITNEITYNKLIVNP